LIAHQYIHRLCSAWAAWEGAAIQGTFAEHWTDTKLIELHATYWHPKVAQPSSVHQIRSERAADRNLPNFQSMLLHGLMRDGPSLEARTRAGRLCLADGRHHRYPAFAICAKPTGSAARAPLAIPALVLAHLARKHCSSSIHNRAEGHAALGHSRVSGQSLVLWQLAWLARSGSSNPPPKASSRSPLLRRLCCLDLSITSFCIRSHRPPAECDSASGTSCDCLAISAGLPMSSDDAMPPICSDMVPGRIRKYLPPVAGSRLKPCWRALDRLSRHAHLSDYAPFCATCRSSNLLFLFEHAHRVLQRQLTTSDSVDVVP
jgi:hypothetical protein